MTPMKPWKFRSRRRVWYLVARPSSGVSPEWIDLAWDLVFTTGMADTAPKPFVFVLMPFAAAFQDVYEVCIKRFLP
jgi:hypothetical protein